MVVFAAWEIKKRRIAIRCETPSLIYELGRVKSDLMFSLPEDRVLHYVLRPVLEEVPPRCADRGDSSFSRTRPRTKSWTEFCMRGHSVTRCYKTHQYHRTATVNKRHSRCLLTVLRPAGAFPIMWTRATSDSSILDAVFTGKGGFLPSSDGQNNSMFSQNRAVGIRGLPVITEEISSTRCRGHMVSIRQGVPGWETLTNRTHSSAPQVCMSPESRAIHRVLFRPWQDGRKTAEKLETY